MTSPRTNLFHHPQDIQHRKDLHYRIILSNHQTIYVPNDRCHTQWEDTLTYGWHAIYARARRTRVYKDLPPPPYPQYKDNPPAYPFFKNIITVYNTIIPLQF